MVGRAKSETKKRQTERQAIDAFRARAVAAYKVELTTPKNKQRGARTVANAFVLLYKRETGLDIMVSSSDRQMDVGQRLRPMQQDPG
jgi:hypothetical protein